MNRQHKTYTTQASSNAKHIYQTYKMSMLKNTWELKTYHMIILTKRITISLSATKKSTITLALAPSWLTIIPNTTQNAMIPK